MEDSKRTSRIKSLTQRQIEVLARVSQFKSSKQIARELGISHHTVDQRVRTIIEKVGVGSRADAARAFLESRDNNGLSDFATYESLVYQLPDLTGDPLLADQEPSSGEWNPAGDGQEQRLKEAQAFYFADVTRASEYPPWISVLLKADRRNDLTAGGRTICIILIMLLALLVMGAMVGLAEGLSRLA